MRASSRKTGLHSVAVKRIPPNVPGRVMTRLPHVDATSGGAPMNPVSFAVLPHWYAGGKTPERNASSNSNGPEPPRTMLSGSATGRPAPPVRLISVVKSNFSMIPVIDVLEIDSRSLSSTVCRMPGKRIAMSPGMLCPKTHR